MSITETDAKALGKVGVLFGGRSAEREISLISGNGVLQALKSKGIDAHAFDPAERSLAELAAEDFDRVFIALHGRYGEDGTLQGALELLGIPYTGSGVMASSVGMDKVTTKIVWLAAGVPTPRYVTIAAGANVDTDAIVAELGLPLIVKPPLEGSTIGITKVLDAAGLQAAVDLARQYDKVVLVEQFIQGREFSVPVLGSGPTARALPIVEIVAPEGNYDYQNKYFTDDTKYHCPAPLDAATTAAIQAHVVNAYRALGCDGWSRIDVLLRASDNAPFLLEVNTSPGMTTHSLVPMAARAEGTSYEDLCVDILRSASLKAGQVKKG
ncbi:D-alanine--D-alanine ligase [Massilia sp. Root133]|uniref:D-alanine--D-alanine ligase n=1 Tax=Massilia cellulosiltytica TaxID=2683234 RepID=A0A7X3K985_9BURK|nr:MULTISPECIES: D-alanine--D-alanine ligase [unclassified Massilia]KQY18836.1 D-alanine--D-alanine ligase [Massilia sp. Root133]KQZ53612.1 D-alanine--D-alanine ligase [Massilia sp. Root1485]MVW61801.1 D-alanine--D-alanine ligase [Telluria cellulosilytica]